MSKIYSPKIITDSLVMCLDTSQNKSYPTDLPVKNGLALWLDAADDSTFSYSSGTSVSQWRDKSELNNHSSQATVGSQPNRSTFQNSRKTVNFDGTNDTVTIPNFISNSEMSIFVVSNCGTTLFIEHSTDTNSNSGFFFYGEGTAMFAINRSPGIIYISNTNWLSGGYSIASAVNSTGLDMLAYKNGTQQSLTLDGRASRSNSYVTSTLYIGSRAANSVWSSGPIAEIIIYNRKVTDVERKQVHTYLGQKWGISNTDRSIVDLSNNNNHGLLGDGTTADMPLFDVYNKGALKLDGSTDYVAVGNATSLNPTTVTVSIWIKRHGYQSSVASYLRRNVNDAYAIIGDIASDNVRLRIYNGSTYPESPNATLSLNEWTNIVGTYDLANIKIYRNGVFVGQTAHTSAISYSSSNTTLTIGRDDPFAGRYMNANYGSVLIYSRALSATEISQNYEAQKSKFANTIVQQGLVLNLDAGNIYSYGGAGTTFYDVSATALSWTINNATYNPSDTKYFSYNGSSSWLESSTSAAYDSQTITMECWFYPTTLAQDGFLFEKGQVNTQYSMFLNSGNVFYFRTMSISNQDLSFTSSTYLIANVWNHIACTYNGSIKIIYVNGVQVTSVAASGTLNTGQTNQYIGKYGNAGNGYPFNGRIGESRVYNIALSAAQVLQNYNATKGRFGL